MDTQVNTQQTPAAPPRRMTLLELQMAIETLVGEAVASADPDTGEIRTDLGSAIDGLSDERAGRVDAYACLIERLAEEEAALDARVKEREAKVKEVRQRRSAVTARIKALRDRIALVALAEGGEVEGHEYRVKMQNGAQVLEDTGAGFPVELADEALQTAIENGDRDTLRSLVGSERLKKYAADNGAEAVGYRLKTVSYPRFTMLAGAKPKPKTAKSPTASN